jgi:hypothetical protein
MRSRFIAIQTLNDISHQLFAWVFSSSSVPLAISYKPSALRARHTHQLLAISSRFLPPAIRISQRMEGYFRLNERGFISVKQRFIEANGSQHIPTQSLQRATVSRHAGAWCLSQQYHADSSWSRRCLTHFS